MPTSDSAARTGAPLLRTPLLALGCAVLAYLGSLLHTSGDDVAYFWPANALVLVALCRAPRRQWPWLLAAAGIAMACVNLWFKLSWLTGAALTVTNLVECAVSGLAC